LQSTNEELESSKEELQSLNEELQTVNAELQSKVDELSATHDDMRNLLNSTQFATIFVDNNMRIKRFTPKTTALINVIQTDVGRPLKHVVTNLDYQDMLADLDEVLTNLTPKETEVQTTEGKWFNMRIMPYRTIDNRIDGAVMTFAGIDDQKEAQSALGKVNIELQAAWKLIRDVFDMNADPLAVLDQKGNIVIANTAFADILQTHIQDIPGINLHTDKNALPAPQNQIAELLSNIEKQQNFANVPLRIKSSAGEINFLAKGTRVISVDEGPYQVLLQLVATE